jgi:hypothetical protein
MDDTINLGDILNAHPPSQGEIPQWRVPILDDLFGMRRFPFFVSSQIKGWPKIAGEQECTKLIKAIASGDYLSDINTFMNVDIKTIVIKILFHQCPNCFTTWSEIAKLENVKLVYVKRQNIFDTVVSTVNSLNQEQWYVGIKDVVGPKMGDLELSLDKFLDVATFVHAQQSYFDVWCNDRGFQVTYEDLVTKWDDVLAQIIKGCGIPYEELPAPQTVQQISIPHQQLVTNIKELKRQLRGSIWGKYL